MKHKVSIRYRHIIQAFRKQNLMVRYLLSKRLLACLIFLGLIPLTTELFTFKSLGQSPQIQTPVLQHNRQVSQPKAPNPINSLILNPNSPKAPNNGIEMYLKDQQEVIKRQRELQEIYSEINAVRNGITDVIYELPSCVSVSGATAYQTAFMELSKIVTGEKAFNLKEANFIVENAYYEDTGNYEGFDGIIRQIAQFLNWKMEELGYNKNSNLAKNLILYRFFTDTLEIKSKGLLHLPYKYDFNDYMGNEDWSNMFVEKILRTNSGQCHSLPLLYLILANEIEADAQLAYSPNHSYIKFTDDNGKWHNIELTNGMLTTDAFVLQSGYIKAEALQNKIYMQPLTDKQLLSHCLFGLAQGYAKKYCYDSFVENVVNKSLELDPNNVNAHMLKSDYLTLRFKYIENQLGINENNYRQVLDQYPIARDIFITRNIQYAIIDNLGYENMPAEAYEKWLGALSEAKQRQESRQMIIHLNRSVELRNIE